MAKKETAEEKLLKIIEATKKSKGLASAPAAMPAPKKPSAFKLIFSLAHINMFLVAGVMAAFLFLIYQINSGISSLKEDAGISADAPVSGSGGSRVVPQMKNMAFYIDQISTRNIFKPFEKKEAAADSSSSGAVLQARISKYKMVGVAWLDVPESATVMLENTTTHETRFLREGDKIDEVTVKTIFTDRVVFSYANEEITVKL